MNGVHSHQQGVTLIELLIAVGLVAILASISYPAYQEHVRSTRRGEAKAALQDAEQPALTPQMIEWRNEVSADGDGSENFVAPADSAGFYWARLRMAQYADRPVQLIYTPVKAYRPSPSGQFHPGTAKIKIVYRSHSFWDASAAVNLPAAIGHYHRHFNGYYARCVAYAVALTVLGEPYFPDEHDQPTLLYPEGYTLRKA